MRPILLAALLLAAPLPAALTQHAQASPFSDFADDENACRQAGAAAIAGAAGPNATRRYDRAHNACMAAHMRARQRGAFLASPPEPPGNPHSAEFPDAFYSIPYATPGYGYDGFSY